MKVKCGNCFEYHASPDEVRACYGKQIERSAPPQTPHYGPRPITERQKLYLTTLMNERPNWSKEVGLTIALIDEMKVGEASVWIENAKKVQPELLRQTRQGLIEELFDGIYLMAGTYYKVYHTLYGRGVQATKTLEITATLDGYDGRWAYSGRAPLRGLRPEMMLTDELAKQFGQVYGFCCNCTKTLTREESLYVGYGPTCARNNGWWYPTEAELRKIQSKPRD